MSSIQNKTVLVTGASSGIGWATAIALAEKGARVMLTARREERLKKLTDEITKSGGTAAYKVVDVTSREQLKAAADEMIERWGQIDVLFNNAGLMPLSFMKNLHLDEWDRMIDVNIKGLLYAVAAVLPDMTKRKAGHIINVSSIAGHVVFPGSAVYSGTKFAVRAISEGLRKELTGETAIRVTIISPGAVDTELTDTITDEDIKEAFKNRKLEPIGPDAIARGVLYAVEQPKDVDVNEIIIRPTAQGV
jgi:NADP-dependent 3-hydroxy acid dehydrogenase YdfG